MPKLAMFKNPMPLCLSLMAAVLVFGSGPVMVGPYGWARGAQGDCYGSQPKGASWVNWYGYSWNSWGMSQNNLVWWNGNNWDPPAAYGGSGYVYGGTNTALANTSAPYQPGLWVVAASYATNFATIANKHSTFTC